jgi:catechol 2,3-dioxygenase-like lactoylglutathione lyase family enzyme
MSNDTPGSAIDVRCLDHVVLTVADVDRTAAWYRDVLGLTVETFGEGRTALRFGDQKLNLHAAGHEIEPHARTPTVGSADFCLVLDGPIEEAIRSLRETGVEIELGPTERAGAVGALISIYVRDPDGNLVELSAEP